MKVTLKKTVNVDLPIELWHKVREWCLRTDVSLSNFIREAVSDRYTMLTGEQVNYRVRPPGRPLDEDVFDDSRVIPDQHIRLAMSDDERKPVDTTSPLDILGLAGRDVPKKPSIDEDY